MKNSFNKFFSILLIIAMILSSVVISVFANVKSNEKEYYVQSGGVGDGSDSSKPLATVKEAIDKANADGLTEADTAHIYILEKSNWATISGGTHNMTAMGGNMPEHKAKIVIESYGEKAVNLCSAGNISQTNFMLTGNVEFKNINLVLAQNNAYIYCGGNNVKFNKDVSVFYASNNSGKVSLALPGSSSGMSIAGFSNDMTFAEDANIIIENNFTAPITLSALISNRNQVFSKNVNFTVNNKDFSNTISWTACNTIVKGDFNVNLQKLKSATNTQGSGLLTINGNLQVIMDSSKVSGNPLEFSNVKVSGEKWFIDNKSGISDLFSFSSVAGEFLVKDGYDIKISSQDGTDYEPSEGKVSLPSGRYNVTAIKLPETKNYYVKNGGTGDGSAENKPLPTVLDAINKAEDDGLVLGDKANIFVMQNDDYDVVDNNNFKMTCIGGSLPNHSFAVTVQGLGDKPVWLSSDSKIAQTNFMFAGDIEFKNITLVLAQNNAFVYCGSGNIKFADDVSIKYAINNSGKVKLSDPDSNSGVSISAFANNLVFDNDTNIVVNNNITAPITLSALIINRNQTFNKNVNIEINNKNISNSIYWASCTTNVKGNFNVNLKKVKAITNVSGTGTLNISGALQVIMDSSKASGNPTDFANIKASGGKWFIDNNSGVSDIIEFSYVPGEYYVKKGYDVKITDSANKEFFPENDKVSLPQGKYKITAIKNAETKNYYVKKGGTGDGSSKDKPLATIVDAVNQAEEDGLIAGDVANIYVMQNENYAELSGDNHGMTVMGGELPKHAFRTVIQSIDGEIVNLASDEKIYQTNFMLNGDVEFKNINLVFAKHNAMLYCGGNNVKFGENTTLLYASNEDGTLKFLPASVENITSIASFYNSAEFSDETNIVIDNEFVSPFALSSLILSRNQTFKKDVNVIFDNDRISTKLTWAMANTKIEGNLNVKAKSVHSLNNVKGDGKLTIDGGLQFLFKEQSYISGDILEFDNIKAQKGIWSIADQTEISGFIDFTDTPGTFKIIDGSKAYARNSNGEIVAESSNGLLVLPAGKYTVSDSKTVKKYMLYYKSGAEELLGTSVTVKPGKKYIMNFGISSTALLEKITVGGQRNGVSRGAFNVSPQLIKTVDNGNNSYTLTYEITIPEDIQTENNMVFLGLKIPLDKELFLFDLNIYDSEDVSKKNLASNTDYKKGLDNVTLGAWTAWFPYWGGENIKVWKSEDGKKQLEIVDYDESKFLEAVADKKYMLYYKSASEELLGTTVGVEPGKEYVMTFGISTSANIDSVALGGILNGKRSSFSLNEKLLSKVNNKNNSYTLTYKIAIPKKLEAEGNTVFLGVKIPANRELYLFDLCIYDSKDSKKKNIASNTDYQRGLDCISLGAWSAWFPYWGGSEVYSWKSEDGKKQLEIVDYDESKFLAPVPEVKQMVYFRNGANPTQFAEWFDTTAGCTYIFKFSVFSTDSVELFVTANGKRSGLDVQSKLLKSEKHINYTSFEYEFTIPSDYSDTLSYVGIRIPYFAEGYLFDVSCYKKNDKTKKECFKNPTFQNGLDNWIFGWNAWFAGPLASHQPAGLKEWTDGSNELIVQNFDLNIINDFIAILNRDDGKWWNDSDIVNMSKASFSALDGTVKDEAGAGIANIKLSLKSDETELTSLTAENGAFKFRNIPEGFYELYMISSAGEYISTGYSNNFYDNKFTVDIVCDMSKLKKIKTGSIIGTVYTPELKTIPDLKIYIRGIGKTVTDKNGHFEFNDIPIGTYEVYAVYSGNKEYVFKEISVKDGVELSLKLKYDVSNQNQGNKNILLIVLIISISLIVLAGGTVTFIKIKKINKLKNISRK